MDVKIDCNSIKEKIRALLPDKAVADEVISSIDEAALENGVIKIPASLLNNELKGTVLGFINNKYVNDYDIRFSGGAVTLTLKGNVKIALFTQSFAVRYIFRVGKFVFDSEHGHKMVASYSESTDGIPSVLYMGYPNLLCKLTNGKQGIKASETHIFADFEKISSASDKIKNSNVVLKYVSSEKSCLTLQFEAIC